jgi:ABC-2 type transport system ATP-binding protein
VRFTAAAIPPSLAPLVKAQDGEHTTFAVADVAQIEFVLSELRSAGIKVEDMEMVEVDLEDVFMEIVRQ